VPSTEAAARTGRRVPKVIAVTSGKGGVGKTTTSIHLALAMAANGRAVVLFDADLGLANVDVLLGLKPRWNLSHVFDGSCELQDVILPGPGGIRIVPGASGIRRMAELDIRQRTGLIHGFSTLSADFDTLIVDTPAGVSSSVTDFCQAAQEVVVVVCNEPASLTDAYAVVKVLHQDCGVDRFRIVVNMVRTVAEGRDLFDRLVKVAGRYLDVALDLVGIVPFDERLRRGIRRQRPALLQSRPGPAVTEFKRIASRADNWPVPSGARGGIEFFVERLVGPTADGAMRT
jgi:flagellar biosynthesis protein FlhG